MKGLFFDIEEKKKPSAAKVSPPFPVWLSDDHSPNLDAATVWEPDLSVAEMTESVLSGKDCYIIDVESYPNYFQLGVMRESDSKIAAIEFSDNISTEDWRLIHSLLFVGLTIGFNSLNYDIPVLLKLLDCHNAFDAYNYGNRLIQSGEYVRPDKRVNHIDLINVAPLKASLKTYGARMHAPHLQDLPFPPGKVLSDDQKRCVKYYNVVGDLPTTKLLLDTLKDAVSLRYSISQQYNTDVRSKSDAQISEAVLRSELGKYGISTKAPAIDPGTVVKYQPPTYLRFQSETLNNILNLYVNADFVINQNGHPQAPPEINDLSVEIANTKYALGMGGLHSKDSSVVQKADNDHILIDRDVASYYPFIILNCGLFPAHLGSMFLHVYRSIVERRIEAKRAGDSLVANSLKITINGMFGKLGSMFSPVYSPQLLLGVTITGQLSLLMLIERLELSAIHVVSANTDGIVIKCHKSKVDKLNEVIKWWEQITGYETEETEYSATYARDISNYFAIKTDGKVKRKGVYVENKGIAGLHKNPDSFICADAVERYLVDGTTIEQTIGECRDIRKFVTVRSVKGGGAFVSADGSAEYVGRVARWYVGVNASAQDRIVYASTGQLVAGSGRAVLAMDLPDKFPDDVDFQFYIDKSFSILRDIGAV